MLVDIADQPDDLLIIGTGRRAGLARALRRSVSRYCLAHAKCPVLAIPPSALMDEMSHGLRSWHCAGTRSFPTARTPEAPPHSPTRSPGRGPDAGWLSYARPRLGDDEGPAWVPLGTR